MVGIVQPDGEDLADAGDRRPQARLALDPRQGRDIQLRQGRQAFGCQRGAVDVPDMVGQIADMTVSIKDTRFLGTLGTVTQ